jgi:hypothetical protein
MEEIKVKKLRLELLEYWYCDWADEEQSDEPDLVCPGPERDPLYLYCG